MSDSGQGAELLRIVDGITRDKNIERDQVIADLEQAILSAARKHFGTEEGIEVTIDRMSGEIAATHDDEPIDPRDLGRIAAQTAKQVMIQKLREAERDSIQAEFETRKGSIITGNVSRFEGGSLVVNLGRTEGFLPRSEQIPGESHNPGDRVRALILDIREFGNQIRIILSRTHPDLIRRLFELEVPEVAERIIEVKALAREAGYRTKIAVTSIDTKVDPVGACVGVRGSRIKNIVDELSGEKIDIVRWNESSQILIANALKPAEIKEIALCFELSRATVVVDEDQLSLAIGKRGQNVRLAARLTGWDIDILTPPEFNAGLDVVERVLTEIEGLDAQKVDKIVSMGLISLLDLEEVGPEVLAEELEIEADLAVMMVARAGEEAKRIAASARQAAEEAAAAAKEETAAAADAEDGAEQADDQEVAGEDGEQQSEDVAAEEEALDDETPDPSEAADPTDETGSEDDETADPPAGDTA